MPIYMVLGFVILLFSFSVILAGVTYSHRKVLTGNGKFVYEPSRSGPSTYVFSLEDRADVFLCVNKNGRVTIKMAKTEVPTILFKKLGQRLAKYAKDFEQDFKS